jgi:hypothetical protein
MSDILPDRRDDSLPALLAAAARSWSDGRLAIAVVAGLLAAAAAAIAGFEGWVGAAGTGCALAAFGGWGIADREGAERDGARGLARAFGLLRLACVVAGVAGVLVAVFTLLHLVLGTWIS